MRHLSQKMARIISEYAQQNGFVLVIDDAQIPVYYAIPDIELSGEMVKRYDAANPVAGTPATPKPPTRPASPTPAAPSK